jgi:hypothetical protein
MCVFVILSFEKKSIAQDFLEEQQQMQLDSLNIQTVSDTIIKQKRESSRMDFTIDAFCNVLGVTNHNAPSFSEPNNILLYYNLTFMNCLNIKEKIILNTYFYNELGYKIYFDSISLIVDDRYDFNNSLLLPFGYKNLSISLSANINSQFWKHYDYRTNDEGETERFLYTSARSPSYTTYSGGINYSFWEQASLNLGIASAKKTKIKNQSLFDERKSEVLYDIEKGKKRIIVFGFNLTLQIPQQKILKNIYFENFTEFFIQADAYQALKHATVDMKNAFHYVFFSRFRLSLKTDIKYDMDAFGTKPYIVNQLMLGVFFNNNGSVF